RVAGERQDEGPGGLVVDAVLEPGEEGLRPLLGLPLEVEADVDVAPGLVGLVGCEVAALLRRDVADRDVVRLRVLLPDLPERGRQLADRLVRAPLAVRPPPVPALTLGELLAVDELA